jgi:hypothetical protein
MKENFTQWMDETLNSMDGIHRAEVTPYFQSKLMNRWKSQSESKLAKPIWLPDLKLKFMLMALGIIFLLNTLVFVFQYKSNHAQQEKPSLKSFSTEFSLAPNSY